MEAWICPKCGRVWNGLIMECKPCNDTDARRQVASFVSDSPYNANNPNPLHNCYCPCTICNRANATTKVTYGVFE